MTNTNLLIRLEAAIAALLLAAFLFFEINWDERTILLVAAVLIAPDLSLIAYRFGPRAGAIAYNLAHWAVLPLLLLAPLAFDLPFQVPRDFEIATVWLLHILIDRALGFGLKRATGFHDTHLGRIGGK